MFNPASDIVVLPPFSCVGNVVQVSAVTIAQTMSIPPHLEDIVVGFHPSLGAEVRAALTDFLYKYNHVFLAPGDPVTCRTQAVRHEIETVPSLSVVGHVALHRQDSKQNKCQSVLETCWKGDKLNQVTVPGCHPL